MDFIYETTWYSHDLFGGMCEPFCEKSIDSESDIILQTIKFIVVCVCVCVYRGVIQSMGMQGKNTQQIKLFPFHDTTV